MNKTIVAALFVILLPMCARADEPTFEDLKAQFEAEVIAMAFDDEIAMHVIGSRLTEVAQRIFGPHPGIIRAEALRLYNQLTEFDPESLDDYIVAEQTKDLLILPIPAQGEGFDMYMLAAGWDPSRTATLVKSIFISHRLSTDDFARRSILSGFIPEKFYKFPEDGKEKIVVESLGEYFIIEFSLTDAGVFMPEILTWMKRKPVEQ